MTDQKPCKSGLDFINGKNDHPMIKTRKGWEKYGENQRKYHTPGFHPVLADCGEYYRLNYGAQDERQKSGRF